MTFISTLLQTDNMQFAVHCVLGFLSMHPPLHTDFDDGFLAVLSFIHSEVSASCIAASMWDLAITTFRLQRSFCTMAVQLWYSVFSCSDFGFVLQRD